MESTWLIIAGFARDVKCRSCGAKGHIQLACGPGEARSTEEAPSSDTLAIE